ncbi:MAG: CoA transferase [Kiritimatiellia bacterium]|jgi:crotonobetainyl-CoA:carnitine CoA-transferase CaiB-like acyl-CoA transferase|nr:CoA transferase [Pseudomonadales bacterium]MDP6469405.1 CoA transferase [Pseudomonadales bacterium]MDP6828975.1 CoA transferase [Pseudomonadales bacterium]MDP7024681.1 CoA transferase [Kiritimatiellia bacterium]|tara:strand:+ start:1748 stop:2959 length:1212 start_codon:yes stop_codon:yes gene_type:complete
MTDRALVDLTILDLSVGVSGAYCTRWFADFGADVIRIESPEGGDPIRSQGPFKDDAPHPETGIPHLFLDAGKKSVALDIDSVRGRDLMRQLAARADLLVEDSSPGTMAAKGLDYEQLAPGNDQLVYLAITPWGQTGPYRDRPATELTLGAQSGTLNGRRVRGERPINWACQQGYYVAGRVAFIAAMGALLHRETLGEGQYVDFAEYEAMAGNDNAAPTTYSFNGISQNPPPPPHRYGSGGVGSYPCKDGFVDVLPGVGGLKKLAVLLGDPELANHEMFTNHPLRMQNAAEFDKEFMEPYLENRTRAEIVEAAQDLGMPFSYAVAPDELLKEPQLIERGFFVDVDQTVAGSTTMPGAPAILSETPIEVGAAPTLGESTLRIMAENLNLSEDEIGRLQEEGVIGT